VRFDHVLRAWYFGVSRDWQWGSCSHYGVLRCLAVLVCCSRIMSPFCQSRYLIARAMDGTTSLTSDLASIDWKSE